MTEKQRKDRRVPESANLAPSEFKKRAIKSQHGGTAACVRSEPTKETHGGQTAREGALAVFDFTGHPMAERAYAWSCAMDDARRLFFAALDIPTVTSPCHAAMAAIVAEGKARRDSMQYRGIIFIVTELAPGQWTWSVEPPESVSDYKKSSGRLPGERSNAIAAAKRQIDAQYAKNSD